MFEFRAAMHAFDETTGQQLLDEVRIAHTGPDVLGLAWWWETGQ